MSMLIEGADGVMTYVVGDERVKQLVAAFPTIQQASRGQRALQDAGQADLVLHNITHPKCPEWIREIVLADPDYCARMATNTQTRADGVRRQAEALMAEVERLERVARKWGKARDEAARTSMAATSAPDCF